MAGRLLYNLPNATTVESGDKFLIQQGVSSKQVDEGVLAALYKDHATSYNKNPADGSAHNADDIKDTRNGGSVQDFIDAQYTTVAELATGKFKVGTYVKLTDRALGIFLVGAVGTADGKGILDAGNGNTAVIIDNYNFLNIKAYGADGTPAKDTAAFYRCLDKTGYIDLQGLTINVTVSSSYIINKDVIIRNGKINFSSATLQRVFIWKSGSIFRFERVHVLGNSNGSINDSFDTTSGTYALIRAELDSDGAAKNLQLDNSRFERLIVCEDNKNAATSADEFLVRGGYARNCEFHNISGHTFSFNAWDGIKITQNKFFNIGALCADFAAFTRNCILEDNEIDGAAGIGKTQIRKNGGGIQLPQSNSISNNNAKNLTGGLGGNVAVLKQSGIKEKMSDNVVVYDGQSNADSIEIFGSCDFDNNDITRTTVKTRSMFSTVTDIDIPNPVINIRGSKGDGMLNFARLQNTSVAKINIDDNTPTGLSKLVSIEGAVNLPSLKITDNTADCSILAPSGVAIQASSGTISLRGAKISGNNLKSGSTPIVLWNAEGTTLNGNTLEHVTGNNFDIINTNSYAVVGNTGTSAWPATTLEKVVTGNSVLV